MGNISVRKLDEDTILKLRVRAAKNGVSMEEEARRILTAAVTTPEKIGDLACSMFGKSHGVSLELPARPPHEPMPIESVAIEPSNHPERP
ncbi:MAG: hypothetical protein GKR94_31655 [Gammaproteobacteria bacterium]|nr:hypothetical protein [Gammaproteobacteria bacterium]